MAALPTRVRPGDLISSDLINAILEKLAVSGVGGSGTQLVPNVFGTFLTDARTAILQPSRRLVLGFTFDVTGAAIDPAAGANANRIVLNQSPPANTLVAPDTQVNLVVSQATAASAPAPTVTRTETISGSATTSFPVNGTLVLVGTNFSATSTQNIVAFDNIAASVTNDPADVTRRLIVTVPAGIPGAPVNAGDAARPGVVLSVRRVGGEAATTTVTITAPVAGQPTITSVDNASPFEGNNITITGTNFTATAQVLIRSVPATIVGTPTSTTIVATVPNFPGITPGAPVPSTLVVSIPGVADTTFSGIFRVRGI